MFSKMLLWWSDNIDEGWTREVKISLVEILGKVIQKVDLSCDEHHLVELKRAIVSNHLNAYSTARFDERVYWIHAIQIVIGTLHL